MTEIKLPTEKECYDLSVLKKWWESPRSDWNIVGLIHSELSEALKNYREGGDIDHFNEEIADCVLRCKTAIYAHRESMIYREFEAKDVPDVIGRLHRLLEVAVDDFPFEHAMEFFIYRVFESFDEHAIRKAIVKKHAYNHTRPEKHGGKLC